MLAAVPPIELFGRPIHLPDPLTIFLREWVWWTFTNGFSVSLVLPGVLVFLGLVLFYRLGSSLGLPSLFWRESPRIQFMVGIGVGALVWQVFLAGYLFEEFATNFTVDRPPFCEVRPYAPEAGIDHPQFPGRFRTDPTSIVSVEWYALAVGTSVAVLTLTVLAIVLAIQYLARFVRQQLSGWTPYQHPRHEPPVAYAVWLPLGAAGGWVVMSVVTAAGLSLGGSVTGKFGEGMLRWAGWGNAAGRQSQVRELIKQRRANEPLDHGAAAAAGKAATDEARDWYKSYAPVYGTFILNFGLILAISLALIAAPPHLRFFTPAVGIVLLLNVVVCGHVLLTAFPPLAVSGDFILLCLLTLVVLAGRAYKFRFPNMPPMTAPVDLSTKYTQLAEIEARVTAQTLTAEGAAEELAAAAGGRPIVRQVFSKDVRYPNPKAWSGSKPPMAIICASGGGSRSAAWTMKVLLDLEERFLNSNPSGRIGRDHQPVAFPYHVRLVSGASGGMIGAAYYVTSLAEPPGGIAPSVARNPVFRPGRLAHDPLTPQEMFDDTCRDFLTPATHTLVNRDLLSLFSPIKQRYDRGQALEDAMKVAFHDQLHVPFGDLRAGEAAGWRPSLIFSPMLVEDGRQLFISNLGLRSVTQNRAYILGESDAEAPTDPSGFALLSREGVEFFKLFPEATEFTVATAARMSATFPYVMPAVSLPTNPPRRVVDAGYYDNYGVGIVASWLFNHVDWVKEHVSGVVIVQIRDGVSEGSRKREVVPDSFPPLAYRGLQWLTTPMAGLWSSWMAANAFRNDNLLHLLNDFFVAKGFPTGFFATVAFELGAGEDVALNFTLSENEIGAIKRAIAEPAYVKRADSLVNWWHARLAAPEAPVSLTELDLPDLSEAKEA
jgi:hypothetical protein